MTEPIAGGYILPQQFYTLDVALCWCLFRLRSCYRTRDQSPYTKTNCSINANFWPRVLDPRSYCTTILPVPFRSVPERSGVFLASRWAGPGVATRRVVRNRATIRPTNRAIKRATNRATNRSVNRAIKRATNRATNRSMNRATGLRIELQNCDRATNRATNRAEPSRETSYGPVKNCESSSGPLNRSTNRASDL